MDLALATQMSRLGSEAEDGIFSGDRGGDRPVHGLERASAEEGHAGPLRWYEHQRSDAVSSNHRHDVNECKLSMRAEEGAVARAETANGGWPGNRQRGSDVGGLRGGAACRVAG